jgi:hypothetical protein
MNCQFYDKVLLNKSNESRKQTRSNNAVKIITKNMLRAEWRVLLNINYPLSAKNNWKFVKMTLK